AKLKRLGPMTINALAKEMVMDRTTLGRNVLPLERDGMIKIEASATDGRAKVLHLTKNGEKRLQAGREAWEQAQRRFDSRFGAKRAADFRAMLHAVVASDLAPKLKNEGNSRIRGGCSLQKRVHIRLVDGSATCTR